jgi:hypothetical protein
MMRNDKQLAKWEYERCAILIEAEEEEPVSDKEMVSDDGAEDVEDEENEEVEDEEEEAEAEEEEEEAEAEEEESKANGGGLGDRREDGRVKGEEGMNALEDIEGKG